MILIYSKITWKRLLYLFLISSLLILIVANAYIRNQMPLASFQAWTCLGILLFAIPFLFKIGFIIYMITYRMKMMKKPEYKQSLVQAIAEANHHAGATEIEMIVENLFYLIKKVHPLSRPQKVKLVKGIDVLKIDGVDFDLEKLIHQKDKVNMGRRVENDLLMNKSIQLSKIEELLNKRIMEEWDKIKSNEEK